MDVEVTLSSSPSYSYTISASCDRGDRTTMEDRICVHQGFTKHGTLDFLLLGLFDGHAGDEAAQCAKEILPLKVDRLLRRGWSEEKALRQAFHDTNEQMLQEMISSVRTMKATAMIDGNCDGIDIPMKRNRFGFPQERWSTSVIDAPGHHRDRSRREPVQRPVLVCYVKGDYGRQIVAIRPVFWESVSEGSSWYPAGIRATSPHSLNAQERARIARDGGQVAIDSRGDARVVFSWCNRHCWARQSRCSHRKSHQPCLNITRSLGDFWSFSSDTGRFAISCDPDIRSFSIADDNIFGFCLHSDGVALSPGHIVMTMNLTSSEDKENASNASATNLASELIVQNRHYLRSRAYRDNAAVIVVLVNQIAVNR